MEGPAVMNAVLREIEPDTGRGLPADLHWLLDDLRRLASRSRATPRLSLTQACARLCAESCRSPDACAALARSERLQTLIRVMGEGIGRAPVFYQPGTARVSFDEAWLVSALDAAHRGDRDSLAFLVLRRVLPNHRAAFLQLIRACQVARLPGTIAAA
ncbi:MAG: hypothetical protein AAGD12_12335, partial [Pseudomonadota bacterium]